jgi:hypothetical protein
MQLKLEPFDEAPPESEPAQRMSCFTATLNLSCSSKNSDALGLRKDAEFWGQASVIRYFF